MWATSYARLKFERCKDKLFQAKLQETAQYFKIV